MFIYLFILGGVPAPSFLFRAHLSALGRRCGNLRELKGAELGQDDFRAEPLGSRVPVRDIGSCAEVSGFRGQISLPQDPRPAPALAAP